MVRTGQEVTPEMIQSHRTRSTGSAAALARLGAVLAGVFLLIAN